MSLVALANTLTVGSFCHCLLGISSTKAACAQAACAKVAVPLHAELEDTV